MAKLIYRVVSACGALGYGFPKSSMDKALEGRIDAVISDAGSMDAGPYYLGTGTEYFEREAVKQDYRYMVEAGQKIDGPVILGSCGMAGGNRNLEWMVGVAKEVFAELDVRDAKVAVIGAELDPTLVIHELKAGKLLATGAGPELSESALRESTIVGQMGIHPLMTALESGAKYILAGRSCDIALFASDMIRRGIDAGLAYHVGHVLECGALACDPGSPSDCLVAEIYDDGTAVFVAPDPHRRCTAYSIAAHSLYEESHPAAAILSGRHFGHGEDRVLRHATPHCGIRGSLFIRSGKPWPWSIKLEGARRARRQQGLADPHRSRRPAEDPGGRAGLWPQWRAERRRCRGIATRTRHHHRNQFREDRRCRQPAREPADALPHPLRLSGSQGDRRQHRLSDVAELGELSSARTAPMAPSCRAARAIRYSSRTMTRSRRLSSSSSKPNSPTRWPTRATASSRPMHQPGSPAAHCRPRPGAARLAAQAEIAAHLPPDQPRTRVAAQPRRPRRLCLVALPSPAERGGDQERHVPDHLLPCRMARPGPRSEPLGLATIDIGEHRLHRQPR